MLDGVIRSFSVVNISFFFILSSSLLVEISESLQCLEGSDCLMDASCGECSGVACTRVVSHNLDDNKEIALTCLPYDTRTFNQLEESGCKQQGDRQICICYSYDYCNSTKYQNGYSMLTWFCILLFILLILS